MLKPKDTTKFQFRNWTLRIRLPEGEGPHPLLLLLHGWTGDEDVMWIFTDRLPARYLMLAPRGIYEAQSGGFGWSPHTDNTWPTVEDFRPAVSGLVALLDDLRRSATQSVTSHEELPLNVGDAILQADFSDLNLLGFSQGAALAYTFALLHPERVNKVAGLASFLPKNVEQLMANRPLVDVPVFVAHGTLDDQVPVKKAREAVEILNRLGAEVTYCEEEVGHKLSAGCFRALDSFFT